MEGQRRIGTISVKVLSDQFEAYARAHEKLQAR